MILPGSTRAAGQSKVIGASLSGLTTRTWFGDGSDGDLALSDNQTLELDVAPDEGQIFKQYKSLIIPSGAILRPSHRCNGTIITVQGDLVLSGTISVDKCAPLLNANEYSHAQSKYIALCGGLTGGNGGSGGQANNTESLGVHPGQPGTGGLGFTFGGGYGGGSGCDEDWGGSSANRNGGSGEPRPPAGTSMPYPAPRVERVTTLYGAGGTGFHQDGTAYGGGGPGGSGGAYVWRSTDPTTSGDIKISNGKNGDAYGGGALFLFVKGNVVINSTGTISADGGNGAAGVYVYNTYKSATGGGGAGGGGIIAIVYGGTYTNNGSVHANGGHGGVRGAAIGHTTNGADGSIGTVFISSFDDLMN